MTAAYIAVEHKLKHPHFFSNKLLILFPNGLQKPVSVFPPQKHSVLSTTKRGMILYLQSTS